MGIIPILLIIYLVLYKQVYSFNIWFVGAVLVLICILMGFTMLRQSADQLNTLARETTVVGKGVLVPPIKVDVDGELKDIAENFNIVLDQLNHANQDIRNQSVQLLKYAQDLAQSYEKIEEEEELRNNLCRYVSGDLLETLIESKNDSLLRNQRKPVTVMFADIRSFTALAEHMAPEDVVAMLNQFFSIMVDIVFKHKGMLDKLVGDQLMAIFGHVSGEEQGANDAVRAAMEMHEAIEQLMRTRAAEEMMTFDIGIGINTGNAIFAHVGSENRMDYTVIGDTVNAAARLEKHAGPGETVIGDQTYSNLPDTIPVGMKAEVKVKNRSKPVVCYKITSSESRGGV